MATRRFFRRNRGECSEFKPTVSILKPVKGVDAQAFKNFASFCQQDFDDYELLFGVADGNDPAVALVEQLQKEFPDRRIALIVAPTMTLNPKSSTLEALGREASGEVLVISDADMRVGSDYLSTVVAPLADPKVGIVTCLYHGTHARTLAARLEGLHAGQMFLPSVILAHECLGQVVGMGATLALRKSDFQRIGGYSAFGDLLMDDFQLVDRIRKIGLESQLANCVVENILGNTQFIDQWRRELRWARGIRITSPTKYLGIFLTYPIALSAMLVALYPLVMWTWVALGVTVVCRAVIAWDIGRLLPAGGSPPSAVATSALLLPLRELLSFTIWCGGLIGRKVYWRGQEFGLARNGQLLRTIPKTGGPLRAAVRWLDALLRRRQNIFEFTQSTACMLRISRSVCTRPIELSHQTLSPGMPIGELHIWNDQMPKMQLDGASLAWARQAEEHLDHSLRELARVVRSDGRLIDLDAFKINFSLTPRGGRHQVKRFARRIHFETVEPPAPAGLLSRLHRIGENVLIWLLIWTFNPGALRNGKLMRMRTELWISRSELLRRYGEQTSRDATEFRGRRTRVRMKST